MKDSKKKAVHAHEVPPRVQRSIYPEPFASRMDKRIKTQLGEFFGLQKFGVNRTELLPGGESALLHKHSKQEEFIFILEGTPTLVLDYEEIELSPGMCAGFPPNGSAHKLINRSQAKAVYLEIGDRERGDEVSYPQDDIVAKMGDDGKWIFTRKNGNAY